MKRLLIIGGASLDTLHLSDRTVATAGGVGMYTAMAAHRCGADVSMMGPRPDPCPDSLLPVAERLAEWIGPVVVPEQLPRFEISYKSRKTEYLDLFFGAAQSWSLDRLPSNLSKYDLAHVAQKSDLSVQLAFIAECRERGVRLVSAGTYPKDAQQRSAAVRTVIEAADIFFMNKREAAAVFGSLEAAATAPGKLLFITMGRQGAQVIQGQTMTAIQAVPAQELDPTGAGDTFCGATLAFLLQGEHPLIAARQAMALAAEMITAVGPAALFSVEPPPEAARDGRVDINMPRVEKVAGEIKVLAKMGPSMPFVGSVYPVPGHPQAVDFFFAATLQQFSFWSAKNGRYDQPLIAPLGGVIFKGSDYLWAAFKRKIDQEPDFCSPVRQANMGEAEMRELFRDDDGQDPMPALELHLKQAHSYGRDMLAVGWTPQAILQEALASPEPVLTFLRLLDKIGGYKEDPLRKKSSLLLKILNQRPEKFLPLREDEEVRPIIDYHVLRSALRIGLVDVIDEKLTAKLGARALVSAADEWAVRCAAYQALEAVHRLSGCHMDDLTWYFFNARRRCPEMFEPECADCHVEEVCAQRKGLFQPVLRTTYY